VKEFEVFVEFSWSYVQEIKPGWCELDTSRESTGGVSFIG